jgi:SAM-dependent methyltransferase
MIFAPARVERAELIDGPIDSLSELAQSFRDIALANRYLGGTAAVRYGLRRFNPSTVLDIGCGAADIPQALVEDAKRRGRELLVTCLDSSEAVLEVARQRTGNPWQLKFVEANGTNLPFGDASFDVAMCNLALHHLAPPEAVQLLREMRRVGRAPMITDLCRSDAAFIGTWLFTRVVSRNRLTLHDGPLSALRAYTADEARDLARAAGWEMPVVTKRPFFRIVMYDAATV